MNHTLNTGLNFRIKPELLPRAIKKKGLRQTNTNVFLMMSVNMRAVALKHVF